MVDKQTDEEMKQNILISGDREPMGVNTNSQTATMNLNNNNSLPVDLGTTLMANDMNESCQTNHQPNSTTQNSPTLNAVTNLPVNNFISQSNLSSFNSTHHQHPPNQINNQTHTGVSNFVTTNIISTTTVPNQPVNGNLNSTINSNQPSNLNVAASCPTANNLNNQNSIQITNQPIMNSAANSVPNMVSNSDMQDDDSEDESEILEESPCGRWLKRREEVILNFKILKNDLFRIMKILLY